MKITLIAAALASLLTPVLLAIPAHAWQQATYAYDGRGRLVQVSFDDGSKIVYSYDAAGNRTTQVITVPGS